MKLATLLNLAAYKFLKGNCVFGKRTHLICSEVWFWDKFN